MFSRFKWFQIFRYYYLFIIGFAMAIIISLSFFLYKNFYQTITQSGEILILKEQVILEMVNMPLFNQVLRNLAIKESGSQGVLVKDKKQAYKKIINPFEMYSQEKE